MRSKIITTGVIATIAGYLLAVGAGSAAAAPSTQDTTFMTGNEQVNLAEQAIGATTLQRGQGTGAKDLATMTISDHKTAQAKLTALAASLKVTLPTAPNATQQAQGDQLKTVASGAYDLTYAQIQVAGHQMSIAATQLEISSGSDAAVVSYAKGYLPVAQMHLQMAQTLLTALGGDPGTVPAGSGGLLDSRASSSAPWWIALGGAMFLIVAGASLLLIRRRPQRT